MKFLSISQLHLSDPKSRKTYRASPDLMCNYATKTKPGSNPGATRDRKCKKHTKPMLFLTMWIWEQTGSIRERNYWNGNSAKPGKTREQPGSNPGAIVQNVIQPMVCLTILIREQPGSAISETEIHKFPTKSNNVSVVFCRTHLCSDLDVAKV